MYIPNGTEAQVAFFAPQSKQVYGHKIRQSALLPYLQRRPLPLIWQATAGSLALSVAPYTSLC